MQNTETDIAMKTDQRRTKLNQLNRINQACLWQISQITVIF